MEGIETKPFRKEWSSLWTKSMCFGNNTVFTLHWLLHKRQPCPACEVAPVYTIFNCVYKKKPTTSHLPFALGCQKQSWLKTFLFCVFGCWRDRVTSSPLETEPPWSSSLGLRAPASELEFSLPCFLPLPSAFTAPLVRWGGKGLLWSGEENVLVRSSKH